jgi:hypothetical protein
VRRGAAPRPARLVRDALENEAATSPVEERRGSARGRTASQTRTVVSEHALQGRRCRVDGARAMAALLVRRIGLPVRRYVCERPEPVSEARGVERVDHRVHRHRELRMTALDARRCGAQAIAEAVVARRMRRLVGSSASAARDGARGCAGRCADQARALSGCSTMTSGSCRAGRAHGQARPAGGPARTRTGAGRNGSCRASRLAWSRGRLGVAGRSGRDHPASGPAARSLPRSRPQVCDSTETVRQRPAASAQLEH